MSAIASLRAVTWLVRDTARQALASGASWLMLAGSAVCVAACVVAPLDGSAGVRSLQQQLASWAVHAVGLLLALVLTAGMLPSFLEPHRASVLLAKPVARWALLAGKFLGVLAFVALHATFFVVGVWLVLGVRAGAWDPTFLLCAPLLVLHFAVFFSFSVMLAVVTRNTAASVFGTVLFWLLCWAMNFGRHAAMGTLDPHVLSPAFGWTVDAAYWVLPKPLDFQTALTGGPHGEGLGLSLLASALSGAGLLAVAAYDFVMTDY
jgi:ABC-type transport system involved in multi-copper enzyme maturation permease subunit